jgi:hypothetical protein
MTQIINRETPMTSEGTAGRLQGAPLSIKTNAFHAPKLKRDVMASKLQTKQPVDRPGSASQRQAAFKEAEPENMQTGISEAAGASPAAVPAASPVPDRSSKQAPAARLTTARKGKRAKARTRNSEVTVYYDAVQSPDDAVAKPQQQPKQKQQRGGRAAATAAAAAGLPAGDTDAAAAAAGASDDITAAAAAWAAEEDELFPTQPEPMDADYGDQEDALLPMANRHNSGSLKAAAGGGSKRALRSSSSDSLEQAAAAAGQAGRSGRLRNREDSADGTAAAAAAADSPAADEAADEAAAAEPAAAAGPGSQPARLRDGAEIFKYMQALAEDAAELLPQEQEQKKRGRGRAKKDLRLVDALHQCWQGKVRVRICVWVWDCVTGLCLFCCLAHSTKCAATWTCLGCLQGKCSRCPIPAISQNRFPSPLSRCCCSVAELL